MKKLSDTLIILVLMAFATNINAQYQANTEFSGTISGNIKDGANNQSVEYANVILYKAKDSTLVTGTITDEKGNFLVEEVPAGKFYLVANFIGYEKVTIDNILVSPKQKTITIPQITLNQAITAIDQAEIVGNKNYVEYKIDKKVVNVSQHINSAGGTASDVLENVPSIEVDLDGNVSLRGSSNFTVLIDGRPSILTGSDALRQLPASAIQSMEIITNPSAKYDPDGTAGIINVVMKKQKLKGTSGIVNLATGTSPYYSGDILLNHRAGKFNFSGGISYSDRSFDRNSKLMREYYNDTSYLEEHSNGKMYHNGYNVKVGLDYDMTDNNKLFVTGSYRTFGFGRESINNQRKWNEKGSVDNYFITDDAFSVEKNGVSINLGDNHKFNDKGHELKFNTTITTGTLDKNTSDLIQYVSAPTFDSKGEINLQTQNINKSDGYDFRADLDYTWPFSDKGSLEAGYQVRSEKESSDITYNIYNTANGEMEKDELASNEFEYTRDIHALYFTIANQFEFADVKFGLRAEYTDRLLDQKTLGEDFSYESLDLYPSAYITKRLANKQQVQLNYSRRVNRPHGRFLNPYTFRSDGFTSFKGNPKIEPEFANSLELNYQKYFGRSFISVESYFRQTVNKMTRITNVTESGISERTMGNLKSDYSAGFELMGNLNLAKWWMLMPSGNIYKYHLEGSDENEDVAKNSTNYRFRVNSSFTLPTKTRIDIYGMYGSPTVTVNGTREGYLMTGMGVRHDFLDRKLTVTIKAQDLFDTSHRKYTELSDITKESGDSWRKSPIFSISLSYKINNYKTNRSQQRGGSEDMEGGGGGYEMMM